MNSTNLQFTVKALLVTTAISAVLFATIRHGLNTLTDAEMNLDSLILDGIWVGKINAPWLGQMLEARVNADNSGITEKEYECIRHVCRLPTKTLDGVKQYLFEKYQNEIYGSVSRGAGYDFHDLTPRVNTPDELWDVLSYISLSFPSEKQITDDAWFAICFECPWDEEHGCSILMDKNGVPQEMGGSAQFF